MATQEAYVQVKDLKKHYGDGDARLTVLDGIDTSINRGEICVMLGPSGSGKSTFLNLIGGLEDADGGSIMVDGVSVNIIFTISTNAFSPIAPTRIRRIRQRGCAAFGA